jgi:hypothetical protein
MSAMSMRLAGRLGLAVVLCGLAAGCGERKKLPDRQFASPEEAVAALVAAAEQFNVPELKAILGPEGEVLVSSADTVADRNHAAEFAAQAREHQRLEFDSTRTSAVLNVGAEDWPMPIPVVEKDGKWYFDASAGKEEVLRRRIGQDELDAITVCLGYVEAQRQYARVRHDGAIVNQYAQRVISTPGKQDGLAWQAADGTWQGPVGEQIGAMIGGFALVAAPAEYGVTGIQTFIVGWDGVVYQQDFGDKTLDQFKAMQVYNPDSTWEKVEGN